MNITYQAYRLFDTVVANPPFSLDKWGKVDDKEENKASDSFDPETEKYNRFWRRVPPKSKGDWVFISHMIETTYEGKGKVAWSFLMEYCSVAPVKARSGKKQLRKIYWKPSLDYLPTIKDVVEYYAQQRFSVEIFNRR